MTWKNNATIFFIYEADTNVYYAFHFFYLNGCKSFSFMKLIVATIIAVAVFAKITIGKAITVSVINMKNNIRNENINWFKRNF